MTSGPCLEIVEALARASSVDEIHEICLRIITHIDSDQAERIPISLLTGETRGGRLDSERGLLVSDLTDREKECLYWAAEGKTSWETAKILQISKRTVVFHLQNASRKLNAANRQNAIARAVVLGLITPEVN
jgi:DNA-binding CsgD family transcriptional regulator